MDMYLVAESERPGGDESAEVINPAVIAECNVSKSDDLTILSDPHILTDTGKAHLSQFV